MAQAEQERQQAEMQSQQAQQQAQEAQRQTQQAIQEKEQMRDRLSGHSSIRCCRPATLRAV